MTGRIRPATGKQWRYVPKDDFEVLINFVDPEGVFRHRAWSRFTGLLTIYLGNGGVKLISRSIGSKNDPEITLLHRSTFEEDCQLWVI